MEREKLSLRCAIRLTGVLKNPYRQKAVIQGISKGTDARRSGGLDHSSDEVSVTGMERRVQLIRLH